jgi:hypothetical protein
MIHILNGDALVESFKQSNIKGDYIVWRECLFEGPIFDAKTETDLANIRAEYISNTYGENEAHYLKGFNNFFNKLKCVNECSEVTLWFDYDLFCQVNLMYLLKVIAGYNYDIPVSVVSPKNDGENNQYKGFGGLTGEQLQELFECRKSLSKEELYAAERFWNAYSSTEPLEFEWLLNNTDNTFPFFGEALQAHLERFPSRENGINRIERIILNSVEEGINDKFKIMERVWNEASIYGLGDLQIFKYIEQLSDSNLLIDGDKIQITKLGKAVLDNTENYLELRKSNVWIGGVHLNNSRTWQWDKKDKGIIYE